MEIERFRKIQVSTNSIKYKYQYADLNSMEMKTCSILLFTVMVTIAIEAYRIDRQRIDINESEEKGTIG